MENSNKLVAGIGLLVLLSVMPLTAQTENGVDFTAPFAFWRAGNTQAAGGKLQGQRDRDGLKRYWRSRAA